MDKIFIKAILLLCFMGSYLSFAQGYQSCTQGGGCNYYSGSTGNGVGGVNRQPYNGMQGQGSIISPEAAAQKACGEEKGRIEMENAVCLQRSGMDHLREVGRCQSESNSNWSGSLQGGHIILFLGVNYAVENPTYDKCINGVGALFTLADRDCALIYTRNKNTARTANNAVCAGFYN